MEQLSATSEVLRVISRSPGELEPVFTTILGNAVRICRAKFGTLYLCEGNGFRAVAIHNAPPGFAEARAGVVHPPPNSPFGCAVRTKQVTQVADVTRSRAYIEGDPFVVSAVELGRYRTVISVPMLKENELIGAINIYRQEVRPFADKQIELVQNFAAQAVIAIENARLLNELRQRTADLSESLQQQTATSEVLKVISSSPGELAPVFEAILANAIQICGAKFGNLFLCEGDAYRISAYHNTPPALIEFFRRAPIRPGPTLPISRAAKERRPVQSMDVTTEQFYVDGDSVATAGAKLGGTRTVLAVPMLKENELVGVIVIFHQEVRPFTNKQIELVKNFAAQAVIAIENTRLLNELREVTGAADRDLRRAQGHLPSPASWSQCFEAMLGIADPRLRGTISVICYDSSSEWRIRRRCLAECRRHLPSSCNMDLIDQVRDSSDHRVSRTSRLFISPICHERGIHRGRSDGVAASNLAAPDASHRPDAQGQ